MDLLLHAPSFAKVGASFLGILAAYRLGLGLGWSILLFASALTLWTGAGTAGAVYQARMLASLAVVAACLIMSCGYYYFLR